jgi:alkylation response protein AidB-like acyl-CoA dehydrogenase
VRDSHEGAVGEFANLGLSLMPMHEVRIDDTWFVAGMKGTGSNTIVAEGAFVPEHRFLPYPQAFTGVYRTEHLDEAIRPAFRCRWPRRR